MVPNIIKVILATLLLQEAALAQSSAPVIERNKCEGEGCALYYEAVATGTMPVFSIDDDTASIIFFIKRNERVSVLSLNLHHYPLGVAVMQRSYNPVAEDGPNIPLAPGDTILIVGYRGEGWYGIIWKGKIIDTPAFWPELNRYPFTAERHAKLLRPPHTHTWLHVKTAQGPTGWVRDDGSTLKQVTNCKYGCPNAQ